MYIYTGHEQEQKEKKKKKRKLIVKHNLLRHVGLDLTVEGAVYGVDLLLDRRAELQEVVRHGLAGGLEDVDEPAVCQFYLYS